MSKPVPPSYPEPEDYVLYETRGSLLTLTLNYPEKLNVTTLERSKVLNEYIRKFERDDSLKVCLLQAKGKSFCAGRDVKHQAESKESPTDGVDTDLSCYALPPMEKILVTAVRGYALGVGGYWMMAGDVRIVSETVRYGLREVPTAVLGPYWIQQAEQLPWAVAYRIAVLGDDLSSEELMRYGLVSTVVADEELEKEAQKWIDRLLLLPPEHARVTKKMMRAQGFQYSPEVFSEEQLVRARLDAMNDTQEAALAFKEKRAPNYTGT